MFSAWVFSSSGESQTCGSDAALPWSQSASWSCAAVDARRVDRCVSDSLRRIDHQRPADPAASFPTIWSSNGMPLLTNSCARLRAAICLRSEAAGVRILAGRQQHAHVDVLAAHALGQVGQRRNADKHDVPAVARATRGRSATAQQQQTDQQL